MAKILQLLQLFWMFSKSWQSVRLAQLIDLLAPRHQISLWFQLNFTSRLYRYFSNVYPCACKLAYARPANAVVGMSANSTSCSSSNDKSRPAHNWSTIVSFWSRKFAHYVTQTVFWVFRYVRSVFDQFPPASSPLRWRLTA